MTALRQAAEKALEALEAMTANGRIPPTAKVFHSGAYAITTLRQALEAEPVAEPVGWKHDCAALCANDVELWIDRCPHCGKPRHPQPAQQPLTDEQVRIILGKCDEGQEDAEYILSFTRAIERAHGIGGEA